MNTNTKMKLLTVYIVIGMVWCIIGLPNLLSKSNNSTVKAIGLALLRILAWPVLVGNFGYKALASKSDNETSDDE